jgi:hypothetical protein
MHEEIPNMSLDSQIASIASDYLDDILRSLAPEAAPTPFILSGGPHGVRHIALHSLTDPDFAKTAKTVIPAFIILNEGIEVVLSAFVTDPDICDGKPECALSAYWGPRARELFAAEVTRRKGQPPVVGEWLKAPASASLGPIDDGVRNGLDMAYRIWKTDADDLRERIDAIRSAGGTTDTDVLPLTVDALRECGWLD